ncbi:MAG: DUF2127 domain-containing protein [Polyangiaceae bacterium]
MSRSRGAGVLIAIGLFKLVKVLLLVALGIGALALADGSHVLQGVRHTVAELGFNPYSHLLNRAFGKALGIDHHRLEELGIATFVYAAVFLVEGTGLLLQKRWAEYVTTIVTASFVPFEMYEMVHKPSALKAVGIAVNLAIVVYLVLRLRSEKRAG